MNKKSGLTITMIFNAESLNYGEGIGNISELKKLSRGNGKVYTFASRQALRYDIARLGNKMFGWNLEVVDKSKGTVQFKDECTIKDSEEMDLFGYMKTSKKSDDKAGGSSIRSAAVRLSNAISLEDYKSDMDFLNYILHLLQRVGLNFLPFLLFLCLKLSKSLIIQLLSSS